MTEENQSPTWFEKIITGAQRFMRYYIAPWSYNLITRARAHHYQRFVLETSHAEILQQVNEEGRLQSRYSFHVVLSCAIATLGLLLSSPAVIIGAMLISPLMGPIMSLGFSLCIVDMRQMRRALEALGAGTLLALAISFLIVKFSPLTLATPEILARTQPNLFDLLVAIFSGMAGAYATIKGKGGTIVGVAIATALMPPLAVVGYGLATQSWPIASGAFFLYMTNLLAIALTVTVHAKFYGFGSAHSAQHAWWQTGLVVLTFIALSVPLGISLKNIAQQSFVTQTARAEIQKYFSDDQGVINNFVVEFPKAAPPRITAVIVTTHYRDDAEQAISTTLTQNLSRDVNLHLDQIVTHQLTPAKLQTELVKTENTLVAPIQNQLTGLAQESNIAEDVRKAVFFPLQSISISTKSQTMELTPSPDRAPELAVMQQVEQKLGQDYPGWQITLHPPQTSLPPLYFVTGSDILSDDQAQTFSTILWALKRWQVNKVQVLGYASTLKENDSFDNQGLALNRARHVLQKLAAENIQGIAKAEYQSSRQPSGERQKGREEYQRVEIIPHTNQP